MITPYLPYPLLSGGQTRTFSLLKNLSKKHDITLFSFIRKDEEKKFIPKLLELGVKVEVFRRRPAWQLINILLSGFSWFPFLVSIYLSRSLKKRLRVELAENHYDVVHAEPFYVVPNLPKLNIPLLLIDQTIEFMVYQHFVEEFPLWLLKPLLYFDVIKMKYWESRYWQMADRVVAMSEEDKKIMQQVVPNLEVDIVPNGVDIDYFNKEKAISSGVKIDKNIDSPIILFVGSCTWLQNREAIEILYKKVWPKIKIKLPNARLWIIGKSAQEFFSKFRTASVRVDEIEDIREAYFSAKVLVAPLYGAGGTRYKNFEAFASGVPVVTTSIGIGGTEAVDGRDVIIKDKPEELAKFAVKVIQDKNLSNKLSKNAKILVKEKYDWKQISEKLIQIYEELQKRP